MDNRIVITFLSGEFFLRLDDVSMIVFYKDGIAPRVCIRFKSGEMDTIYSDHPAYEAIEKYLQEDYIRKDF